MNTVSPEPAKQSPRAQSYLTNVAWNWFGAGINLVIAVLLAPYIIRKLGAEGYGLWALLFSVVGYYVLVDFGFRSAIVRYTALYRARGQAEQVNEVLNTALVYFASAAAILMMVTLVLWRTGHRLFHISPGNEQEFSLLILIIGTSCALGTLFTVFIGCLEAFQRFDLSSRINVTTNVLRSGGCAVALAAGQGLLAMALVAFAVQMFGGLLCYLGARRAFPNLSISSHFVRLPILKELMNYGIHTFVASMASLLLDYSPSVLIGNALPVRYVGFYSLPSRSIQYVITMIERMGQVTTSSAAELDAQGNTESVTRLATYTNRYALAFFMPLVVVLLSFGRELFTLWVGAAFAEESVPLLVPLVVGSAVGIAAQFNSSTILFGMARHQRYAYGLLAEAILSVIAFILVLPRFGILGAAWASATLMILSRGLYAPWLVTRSLGISLWKYMGAILARPVVTALPVFLLAYGLKVGFLPGRGLLAVLIACAVVGTAFLGLAFLTCMEKEHRGMVMHWVREKLTSG